jgi:hypothetical protein
MKILLILICLLIFIPICLLIFRMYNKKYNPNIDKQSNVTSSNIDFDFKKNCRDQGGAISLNTNDNEFEGTLLSCTKKAEYGNPEPILFSEINDIIDNNKYNPQNEKEKLELYFMLVYPKSDPNKWNMMSQEELEAYYQDLEFYYKLPSNIMPTTKITIHRSEDKQFYRVPGGVILDQDPNRTGITTPYIEVTRFGLTNSLLRDPRIFNGTYYYPVKGSGFFLPVGNSLIGYNKIHVLKMLDVPNSDILRVAGYDFQSFLQKDSEAIWKKMLVENDSLNKEDYWISACVVDKHAETQDPNCDKYLGMFTKQIYYIPDALNKIIDEIASGHSLRIDYNSKIKKDVNVYYGIGDTGDKLLAQLARNRGFDTLQFLRESQMSTTGNANIGNELLHLVEPIYSQTYLLRLNPLDRPYNAPSDQSIQPKFNYLLDNTIDKTDVKMLTDGLFDPWDNDINFDITIPKRN